MSPNTFHPRNASFLWYLSVCLSVCHIPFVHSILEGGWKFIFFGNISTYASEWWCNSKIKTTKVNVTMNENVEIIFAHIPQKWIDLRQTKIKMSSDPLCTYLREHSPAKMLCFLCYLSVGHIPHIPAVCATLPRDRIKCCTASVCPSVRPSIRPVRPIFSKSKSHKLQFSEDTT